MKIRDGENDSKQVEEEEEEEKTYLGDEGALGRQEIDGEFDGIDHESGLGGGFLRPGAADVGGSVVEDDVEGAAAVLVHELLDGGSAALGGDVLLDGEGAAYGANGEEIDAEDEAADGDMADGDLHPTAGGGAEVEDGAGGGEEAELGIELEELEGGTGAITLLFR